MSNATLQPNVPSKLPPGTLGPIVTCTTNIKKIDITRGMKIFKYHVNIHLMSTNGAETEYKNMSKTFDNQLRNEKARGFCWKCYKFLRKKKDTIFETGIEYIYDGKGRLYTTKPFTKNQYELNIPPCEVTKLPAKSVLFIIKKASEEYEISTSFEGKPSNELLKILHSAINQGPLNKKNIITVDGCNHYIIEPFPSSIASLTRYCKYYAEGLNTTVQALEGSSGSDIYLITDVVKMECYKDSIKLSDVLAEWDSNFKNLEFNSVEANDLLQYVQDLACYIHHVQTRGFGDEAEIVTLKGFGPPANTKEFGHKMNGREVTLDFYFEKEYLTKLNHPEYMTALVQRGDELVHFPIEVLTVVGNQVAQLKKEEQCFLKRKVESTPAVRKKECRRLMNHIFPSKVKGTFYNLSPNFQKVNARILPSPIVEYANSSHEMKDLSFWKVDIFKKPATLNNWMILFVESQIVDPLMRTSVAAMNKWQLMQSAVCRMNFNNDGWNHEISDSPFFTNTTLIIGFDFMEEDAMTRRPLIIGYSANIAHPQRFKHGFRFSKFENCMEMIKIIAFNLVREASANRPFPNEIIIYFNDVIKIQYDMNMIKQIIDDFCKNMKLLVPKFTVISVSNNHKIEVFQNNVFMQDPIPKQHLKPGTVIDNVIVSSEQNEFFLAAHSVKSDLSALLLVSDKKFNGNASRTVDVCLGGNNQSSLHFPVLGMDRTPDNSQNPPLSSTVAFTPPATEQTETVVTSQSTEDQTTVTQDTEHNHHEKKSVTFSESAPTAIIYFEGSADGKPHVKSMKMTSMGVEQETSKASTTNTKHPDISFTDLAEGDTYHTFKVNGVPVLNCFVRIITLSNVAVQAEDPVYEAADRKEMVDDVKQQNASDMPEVKEVENSQKVEEKTHDARTASSLTLSSKNPTGTIQDTNEKALPTNTAKTQHQPEFESTTDKTHSNLANNTEGGPIKAAGKNSEPLPTSEKAPVPSKVEDSCLATSSSKKDVKEAGLTDSNSQPEHVELSSPSSQLHLSSSTQHQPELEPTIPKTNGNIVNGIEETVKEVILTSTTSQLEQSIQYETMETAAQVLPEAQNITNNSTTETMNCNDNFYSVKVETDETPLEYVECSMNTSSEEFEQSILMASVTLNNEMNVILLKGDKIGESKRADAASSTTVDVSSMESNAAEVPNSNEKINSSEAGSIEDPTTTNQIQMGDEPIVADSSEAVKPDVVESVASAPSALERITDTSIIDNLSNTPEPAPPVAEGNGINLPNIGPIIMGATIGFFIALKLR
ncbi:unnamed protein product [Caenorhabditis bovis]|uniref:Piwi domain-containing protein n=1 Tax=Caenorhabditis bovis TaxID=2654633 RepID=A0A8S1FDC2_9PELO|nr:unnamed protein product [Caenorhabditis bovis]